MGTRLYIGNMSKDATEQDLRALFGEAGTIESVEMVMNPQTEKSRGFAFVTMSSEAEAEKAVQLLNERVVNSYILRVNITLPREAPVSQGAAANDQSREV